MKIELRAVSIDRPSAVTAVQLVDSSGAPLVVARGVDLALADGTPVMALEGGSRASAWEVRALAGGDWRAVYIQPGSAVAPLVAKSSPTAEPARMGMGAFVVFSRPHYVRGQASGRTVTAIQLHEGRSLVTAFAPETATVALPIKLLGDYRQAIADARLVQDATGYWLFVLPRPPENTLESVRLDPDLNVVPGGGSVFGGYGALEFDAAPLDGGVAVFATTPAGAMFGAGPLVKGTLPAGAWHHTPFEHPLHSPTVVATGGAVHLAAIERVGDPGARVLRGGPVAP